jgi:uncharacterized protein
MLQYFDAHVRAEALDDDRLENLAYFNVRTLLLTAHGPRRFENSHDLLAYFGALVTSEVVRLREHGIRAVVALGVHPDAVPRRAHFEVWRELPALLEDPEVVAVGELGLLAHSQPQEALLRRQLVLARDLGLPAVISPGHAERARHVRRLLELVADVGIPPSRVLVNHVDYTSFRSVLRAGCWAGLTVAPAHLEPLEAVKLLTRYRDDAPRRCLVSSGLREGPADVLALPKTALALIEAGFSQSEVRALVWGNAYRLFLER